jgi:hypothetical protein
MNLWPAVGVALLQVECFSTLTDANPVPLSFLTCSSLLVALRVECELFPRLVVAEVVGPEAGEDEVGVVFIMQPTILHLSLDFQPKDVDGLAGDPLPVHERGQRRPGIGLLLNFLLDSLDLI